MDKRNIVCPGDFVRSMSDHWEQMLGLKANSALKKSWEDLAYAFNQHIQEAQPNWEAIAMPTGSGKTTGLVLYAALISAENHLNPQRRTGVLIVSRTRRQCEELVTQINQHAGRSAAATVHGDTSTTLADCAEKDVLVVTHEAFRRALGHLRDGCAARWRSLTENHSDLIAIDEMLEGLVENHVVNAAKLRLLMAAIPATLRRTHAECIEEFERFRALIEEKEASSGETTILWSNAEGACSPIDQDRLANLQVALNGVGLEIPQSWAESGLSSKHLRAAVIHTLRAVQRMAGSWAVFRKKGSRGEVHTSTLILPLHVKGPVVLDATAELNPLWFILEDRVSVHRRWNTRRYDRVSLHVSYSRATGKTATIAKAEKRLQRVFSHMHEKLGARTHLLCLPLAIESQARKLLPVGLDCAIGHWGSLDGRNDWRDRDSVVIASLPYRDRFDYRLALMAVHGPQPDDWWKQCRRGSCGDVLVEMEVRQVAVFLIQAINRIRCRRPVDEDGGCLPCDVFLVLPEDARGEAILHCIANEMPGVTVKSWDFSIDAPGLRARSGSNLDRFLSSLEEMPPQETTTRMLWRDKGWCSGSLKELHRTLKDVSHWIHAALEELGVTLSHNGKGGRGSMYHLVKT